MTEDKRRAQYVPIDTGIAFGKTATRLTKKYGNDGLLTWMLFLAAAKRSREQGVFIYTSEAEGCQLLGVTPTFSLDAFFVFTGRGGGTRLVRHGSVRRVSLVNWKSWNDEWKKQQSSERNTRKLAQNAREIREEPAGDGRTEVEGEFEVELEGEVEAVTAHGFFAEQARLRSIGGGEAA
jgi:hypothetical protein